MKRAGLFLSLLFVFTFSLLSLLPAEDNSDQWQKWLDEVKFIITKAEKSVFTNLVTEEDRARFQESFWKVRDPKPETQLNEYKREFYSRRQYAESRLEGINSDRGRIMILLGMPAEIKNFSGYEKVVDCEVWMYHGQNRPGLPSFLHLTFYRSRNLGNYKLFHPGIHSALDLLSPGHASGVTTKYQAYRELKMDFPELARATLSVIPGEGDPVFSQGLSSSGSVFAQIYSLPEKEVKRNYLQNFSSLEGIVDVDYSTREIGGKGTIAVNASRGFTFLSYAIMPDSIQMIKTSDNFNLAEISLVLRVEDEKGKTIHQQERKVELNIDDSKKKAMLEAEKLVFKDFSPIINGKFNVSVTFANNTAKEFFVFEEHIEVSENSIPALVGFDLRETESDKFLPFSIGNLKVFLDPRSIYDEDDFLKGVIHSEHVPKVYLTSIEGDDDTQEIVNIEKKGDLYLFAQPLNEYKSGNYILSVLSAGKEVYTKIVSIIPFKVKKPQDFEWSEPSSSSSNYLFILAQEYLNSGDVDKALEHFNMLPKILWNATTLPVIARAYFQKKDYVKVLELLQREDIERNYEVLSLLAYSTLELKRIEKAAEYFELLRKYGDTVKINRILGGIYHLLGHEEKAKTYWERANKLEKKSHLPES